MPDISAQLRSAVLASGKSQYALAKETEVSQGRIGAFLRGEGSLSVANTAALAQAIGLELALVPQGANNGRKRPRRAN